MYHKQGNKTEIAAGVKLYQLCCAITRLTVNDSLLDENRFQLIKHDKHHGVFVRRIETLHETCDSTYWRLL